MNNKSGSEPVEMRSKSSTPETDIQRLEREVGFWQDQCTRDRETIANLQKLCEEQKADIVALHGFYKAKCGHIMEANQSLCGGCQLESQLATQTERVRVMRECLEYIDRKLGSAVIAESVTPSWANWCHSEIEQALNPNTVVDGDTNKGETK